MAMATSIAAPPLLRRALRGWQGSEEEQLRLERERMLRDNVLVRAARVLLPSHGGPNSLLAARIVDLAWPREVEVTMLSAGADVPRDDLARVRAVFTRAARSCTSTCANRTPLGAILDHAVLGYGAIAVGATDVRVAGRLVSPVIDELLGASPAAGGDGAPRRARGPRSRRPPTDASWCRPPAPRPAARRRRSPTRSRRARGAHVLIAHVVTRAPERRGIAFPAWRRGHARSKGARRGRAAGARGGARLRHAHGRARRDGDPHGVTPSEEILALAREREVDLLVVAANLRQLSGRPFLGHGVEELLARGGGDDGGGDGAAGLGALTARSLGRRSALAHAAPAARPRIAPGGAR